MSTYNLWKHSGDCTNMQRTEQGMHQVIIIDYFDNHSRQESRTDQNEKSAVLMLTRQI